MLKLAFLPHELLTLILGFADVSHAVVALWTCGDKILNKKLSERIESVHLEDRNAASTSRYPKMLSSLLRLRSLRIIRSGSLGTPALVVEELQKLSSTLLSLELRTDDGMLLLGDIADPNNTSTTLILPSTMWNIGASFPELRKLVVWKLITRRPDALELTPQLRSILPPHLEYLELRATIKNKNNSKPLDCLPESLQTLKTTELPFSTSSAQFWPPHLTQLCGVMQSAYSPMAITPMAITEIVRVLPQGLIVAPSDFLVRVDYSSLVLPPGLTQLEDSRLDMARMDSFDWMPTQLASLILPKFTPTAAFILALPSTVTKIHSLSVDWPDITTYLEKTPSKTLSSLWPPNLCDLANITISRYHGFGEITPEQFISSLPPSITKLAVKVTDRLPLRWDFNLPLLRSLELEVDQITFTKAGISSCLRTLSIQSDTLIGMAFLASTSSLTMLTINDIKEYKTKVFDGDSIFMHLPQSLTTFEFKYERGPVRWSLASWSALPSSLQSLTLNLTGETKIEPRDIMPYMPSKLMKLHFLVNTHPSVSDMHSLKCLPLLRVLEIGVAQLYLPKGCDLSPVVGMWPEHHFMKGFGFGAGWNQAVDFITSRRAFLKSRALMSPDPRVLENSARLDQR